jgi:two-component system, OmpR family, response regulator CpxR
MATPGLSLESQHLYEFATMDSTETDGASSNTGDRPMNGEARAVALEPDCSVLLIEDDVELCDLMREYFTARGIRIDAIHDGRRGLAEAFSGGHDLILLDVMLPGLDGFELLRQVRRRSSVPIILLTARTDKADRIAGLDAGADDYLPKPFDPEELTARMRAVLRRAGRPARLGAEAFVVNGVKMSPGTREVWADGNPVELTTIEFDILDLIVRSAGRVISRHELTAAIHQRPASPLDRSLDVHVSHIRKKLGSQGDLIRTVRGVGYLFRAELPEPRENGA